MLTINGIELEFNVLEADTAERFELALENVQKKSTTEGKRGSEIIRNQCQVVFNFFDSVFGEGTADEIFEGRCDFLECFKAFEEAINYANEQQEEMAKLADKYSPNRVQRRHKKS